MNAWYVSFQAFHLHSKTVPRFLSTNLVPYDNKNRFDFILITPRPGLITSRYFARQAAILSLWFGVKRFSYFYGKSIHHLRGSASYCRKTVGCFMRMSTVVSFIYHQCYYFSLFVIIVEEKTLLPITSLGFFTSLSIIIMLINFKVHNFSPFIFHQLFAKIMLISSGNCTWKWQKQFTVNSNFSF